VRYAICSAWRTTLLAALALLGLLLSACAPRVVYVPKRLTPEPEAVPVLSASEAGVSGRLLFASGGDLYVISANGVGRQALSSGEAFESMPSWSPDGSYIAFASAAEGNQEIVIAPASAPGDASWQMQLTEGSEWAMAPAWSRNSRYIAYASSVGGGYGIYTMEFLLLPDTHELIRYEVRRLTYDMLFQSHPSWSPDGTMLAYTTDRGGQWQVYTVSAAGMYAEPLPGTASLGSTAYPAWSPDGTQIAFAATLHGSWDIYKCNLDGSGLTRLTQDWGQDWGPVWSPDGMWIAFTSDRSGNGDIYLVRSDGLAIVQVTDDPLPEDFPAWQP